MSTARKMTRSAADEKIELVEMTVAEWDKVEVNPRQRDTIKHSAKAWWLKTFKKEHASVFAARLPDGTLVKLDGHSRGYIWQTGQSDRVPDVIYVTIWPAADMDETGRQFIMLDSQQAADNSSDKIFGAMRELRIEYRSELLSSTHFASGLEMAERFLFGKRRTTDRATVVFELMQLWQPELNLLDQCEITRERFKAPYVAGALLLLKKHGREAMDFIVGFQNNSGTKSDRELDALQALEEWTIRIGANGSYWGQTMRSTIIRTIVSAFDAYRGDQMFSVDSDAPGLKGITDKQFQKWLAAVDVDAEL